jgi:hypothetical protein
MLSGQNVNIDGLSLFPKRSYGFDVEATAASTTTVDRIDKSTEVRSGADQDRLNIS